MEKDRYVAYVGTYTHENSLGIHIYDLDVENGSISERKMVPISNSSDVIVSHSANPFFINQFQIPVFLNMESSYAFIRNRI